jgi:3alpha(or 20beta)-hydroxysteroid dehydrogenase
MPDRTPPVAEAGRPDLSGRVVIVTGAARGQGRREAEVAAACGASVVACDLADTGTVTFDDDAIRYERLDIRRPDEWAHIGQLIDQEHGGRVHGLVNNAAITARESLLEVTPERMHEVLDVNLVGALLGMQTVAPRMEPGASIVNVGSSAALTGYFAVPYAASKWALRGLSRSAALELGQRGIRVNAVHPGYIQTEMSGTHSGAFTDVLVDQSLIGRSGVPEDMARVVVFLLSDQAGFVTGVDLSVDGGLVSHAGGKVLFDTFNRLSG